MLEDELEGLRSCCVKRFRVIYRVGGKFIEIAAIGSRRIIYQETFRLIQERKREVKLKPAFYSVQPSIENANRKLTICANPVLTALSVG
jgi:hypothetical protein